MTQHKKISSIFGVLSFTLYRTYVLYILFAVILFFSVDQLKVARKTMDYLRDSPYYVVEFAKGGGEHSIPKFMNAIRYYSQFLKVFPDTALAYGALGYCYYQVEKYDQSIHFYKKAIELNPHLFGVYYNLGLIYYQQGKIEKSIEALHNAVNIPIKKAIDFHGMVTPYRQEAYRLGNNISDRRIAEMILGYSKSYEYLVLGHEQQGQYFEALQFAFLGAELSRGRKEFFNYHAGLASYRLGEYKSAVNFFKKSLRPGYDNKNAYHYMALSFTALKFDNLAKEMQKQRDAVVDALPVKQDEVSGLFYYRPIKAINQGGRRMYLM